MPYRPLIRSGTLHDALVMHVAILLIFIRASLPSATVGLPTAARWHVVSYWPCWFGSVGLGPVTAVSHATCDILLLNSHYRLVISYTPSGDER